MTSTEAPDRPPDRVTYGGWEPIYGPERVRQVATGWSLFTVREYTEVRDHPLTGWRRKVTEWWETPAQVVPVLREGAWAAENQPATRVARWTLEYRGRAEVAAGMDRALAR